MPPSEPVGIPTADPKWPWPFLIYELDYNLNAVRLESSANLAIRYHELKTLGVNTSFRQRS